MKAKPGVNDKSWINNMIKPQTRDNVWVMKSDREIIEGYFHNKWIVQLPSGDYTPCNTVIAWQPKA
jgi:hypothetical protein